MGKKQTIDSDTWLYGYMAELPRNGKQLFCYLLTGPHANIAGIYRVKFDEIVRDTGITIEEIQGWFDQFYEDGEVLYHKEWIGIDHRDTYNSKVNPNIRKGIADIRRKAPDFIRDFLGIDINNEESLLKPSKAFESVNLTHTNTNTNTNTDINTNKNGKLFKTEIKKPWQGKYKPKKKEEV